MKIAAKCLTVSMALFAALIAEAAAESARPPYRPVETPTDVVGKATGFFHTERIDGRDWIVDPAGRGLLLCGVDWCWAKGMYSEKAGCSPYGKFVRENYPNIDAWAKETDERLKSWGFNFLAVGASREPLAPSVPARLRLQAAAPSPTILPSGASRAPRSTSPMANATASW